LLSVPFALYAKTVENDKVDDADNDPTNEIQQLSLSGTMLSLSKGGSTVELPSSGGGDNWGTQSVVSDATLDGSGTSASPLKLADNAVTSNKIASGAVTGSKIAQGGASSGQVLKWDGSSWTPGNDESGEGGLSLPFSGSVSVDGPAIRIFNTMTTGLNNYVVWAETRNPNGGGVIGIANSTTGLNAGVIGVTNSSEGRGVTGNAQSTSGVNFGVQGESKSSSGTGVFGEAFSNTGRTFGVYGLTRSSQGTGIYGFALSSTGETYGASGSASSPDGTGVKGENTSTSGTAFGVQGISASSNGRGVYGTANSITGTNYGVYGESASISGRGVNGLASSLTGKTTGVYGTSWSNEGRGVVGWASSGSGKTIGVLGQVESNSGFSGHFTGGKFYVDGHVGMGTESPAATLHINHTNATSGSMPNQGLRIQNASATNRFWTLYTFSSNGSLALYSGIGDGISVGNFNAGTGAYTATSNRHLKTNVSLLGSDILDKIALLEPARYSYLRDAMNQMTIGFMAEDVQPLFPELVDVVGENSENMAINYAGFSVVAIKAIQQQQKQLESLQTENEQLKRRLERLERFVASTAEKGN
jgi:hypothetical protein